MLGVIGTILILYSWVVAAILIFFLYLIGRFYEIRFKQKSGYRLLLLPLGLFVVAAIWDVLLAYLHTGDPVLDFVGNSGPELLFVVGGLVLIGLGYSLHRMMMGRKG